MQGQTTTRGPATLGVFQLVLLGLLTTIGPFSMDLYIPALPSIREDMASTEAAVQFTVSGMVIGLAIGHLVLGVVSDRIGRRRPLLVSSLAHVLATAACALAPTIEFLIGARFVQGVTAAGSTVLILAMIRDRAQDAELPVQLSRVAVLTTLLPLTAPLLGAGLLDLGGWRAVFAALAVSCLCLFIPTLAFVPETRPADADLPTDGAAPSSTSRIREVLRDSQFRRATWVACMTASGIYTYVAASPTLLQDVYGLTAGKYAVVFFLNSLGLAVGVQISAVLLARGLRPARVLLGFALLSWVAVLLILPLRWMDLGLAGLLPCLWVLVLGCGGCLPVQKALAFQHQKEHAGTASSLHGFADFTVAGLIAPIAGIAGITNVTSTALVLLATCGMACLGAAALVRSARATPS